MNKYLTMYGVTVQVEDRGDGKIRLCPQKYSSQLISDIKDLTGAKNEGGYWSVKDDPRSRFVVDLLGKGAFTGESLRYSDSTWVDIGDAADGLWDHQQRGVRFKVKTRRCIDAGEMGIGKTKETFAAINLLRRTLSQGSLWWIAPNSALTSLRTQVRKWKFTFNSTDKIFNYHSLEERMRSAKEPPQIVVFDESSHLKNSSARRTQLAMALTAEMEKKWGQDCAVFLLTGTPAPQNPFDWWSQCEIARPGYLREPNIFKFQRRLANYGTGERQDGGSYPVLESWKSDQLELLPRRLEGLVLVRWKKDCLDLPEKVYEVYECEPDKSILRVAKALLRSVFPAVQLHSKLRQLSDGFQYGDSGESTVVRTNKDIRFEELLDEYNAPPYRLVTYAAFTASVDKCVQTANQNGWSVWRYDGRGQEFRPAKDSIITKCDETIFQKAGVDENERIIFIGNPEAAGMGLTLTPSPAVIYYSNSFKSQYRVQSEDRIHREGASLERGVKIIDLIHLPSDRLALERLKEKRDVETGTMEEIENVFASMDAG